jgi:hypothetical protein
LRDNATVKTIEDHREASVDLDPPRADDAAHALLVPAPAEGMS